MQMKTTKWTYMAGTEGTGKYKTLLKTRYGKLGIRDLGNGSVRIRVEPVNDPKVVAKVGAYLTRGMGWKQPGDGGQHRFSIVVSRGLMNVAVTLAKSALGVGRLKSVQNPAANKVAKKLAAA
jgi:hypothetical protein